MADRIFQSRRPMAPDGLQPTSLYRAAVDAMFMGQRFSGTTRAP